MHHFPTHIQQKKTENYLYMWRTYYCLKVAGCTKATGFMKHMIKYHPELRTLTLWSILNIQVKCCERLSQTEHRLPVKLNSVHQSTKQWATQSNWTPFTSQLNTVYQSTNWTMSVAGCTKATGFMKHMIKYHPELRTLTLWSILNIQVKCCKRIR